MTTDPYANDKARISGIIAAMFEAISWDEQSPPDFTAFAEAVRPDAVLVPAARPAVPTDIARFVDRMRDMHARKAMTVFDERASKTIVHVFGNLAVVIGAYEASIDRGPIGRGANGFLLVRDGGDWQIAAMAWDNEGEGKPLPEELA